MQKMFLFAVIFLFLQIGFAQEPKGTGKTTTIKIDNGFNTKIDKVLPTGHWTFINGQEMLCKEGDFVISNESSVKSGLWIYYNTEGIAMVKLTYSKDVAVAIEVMDTGHNECGTSNIIVNKDTAGVYHVACFEFRDIKKFTVKKAPAKITFSELMTALKSNSKTPSGPYGLVVYSYAEVAQQKRYYDDSEIMVLFPEIKKSLVPNINSKNPKNMVLNASFDADYKYKKVKDDPSLGKPIYPYWIQAFGSPMAFRKSKESFAGFRVIGSNYEIIGGQLKKPLDAGVEYCFQMRLRLKAENHNAVNDAGIIFSEEPLKLRKFKREDFQENPPALLSADSMPIALRQNWQLISGKFTAKGDEKYLYLGVFPKNMKPNILTIDSAAPGDNIKNFGEVYYYIDDIVIIPTDTSIQCPCTVNNCPVDTIKTETQSTKSKAREYTFRNIQFETNGSVLLESSYVSLDSVLNLLDENKHMRIMITGHTDSEGDSTANMDLSEERAKTVYDYLIENHISALRLEYQGKGESQPIDSNKTTKGRARNRRISFTEIE